MADLICPRWKSSQSGDISRSVVTALENVSTKYSTSASVLSLPKLRSTFPFASDSGKPIAARIGGMRMDLVTQAAPAATAMPFGCRA